MRFISLFLRRLNEKKERRRTFKKAGRWKRQILSLPPIVPNEKKLAIIRLDDIGDYLLYRNFLQAYRQSPRFSGYKFTLIGNVAWKPLFEHYDKDSADDTIWVDKHRYFADSNYRLGLWKAVHKLGFEITICPSRTRPLLLDDMLALATGAAQKIANKNTFRFEKWNKASDQLYTDLFPDTFSTHEFVFNRDFSNWVTQQDSPIHRPSLPLSEDPDINPFDNSIVCFIGGAAKSRRWSFACWIDLVKKLKKMGFSPVIIGGRQEEKIAREIATVTGTLSIAGKTTLVQTCQWIEKAYAVISGDSMGAHIGVAFNRPTVILSNGVNAARFVAYEDAGIKGVAAAYAKPYLQFLSDAGVDPFTYYDAITEDILSIWPDVVIGKLYSVAKLPAI